MRRAAHRSGGRPRARAGVAICRAAALLGFALLGVWPVAAQPQAATGASAATAPAAPAGDGTPPPPDAAAIDDPYEAYAAGLYGQALQGFTDRQVERPDDPAVALNLGSAHYKMRNYAEADRTFSRAALAAEPALRAQALYNLGNSAYRQGRLEEAVELYKAALEIDPEDQDAKFNLEFVRNEIRRRHEEAQKRQQQQQPQDSPPQQDQQQQEPPQQGQPAEQPEPGEPQAPEESAPDSDQDGLSDAGERDAENPTDPDNPDTDGDGLADGQEDRNRNGRVDPGETDPNNPDSDGDGVPDGEEGEGPPPTQQGGAEPRAEPGELTPEEAERYLQALEEGRPQARRPRPGSRRRPDKDW